MIITKCIMTRIDLTNVSDTYNTNKEKLLLEKLNRKYESICYLGMLILRVTKILRFSDTFIYDDRLTAGSYINVEFIAEGILLIVGEVVHSCKIVNISDDEIIISNKYIAGSINQQTNNTIVKNMLPHIKKDQTISVIVTSSYYTPNQNQITITAIPFIPMNIDNTIYNINLDTNLDDVEKIEILIKNLMDEINLVSEIKNSIYEKPYAFFEQMFYPFKNIRDYKYSGKKELFDINNVLKYKNVKIISPIESYNKTDVSIYVIDYKLDNNVEKEMNYIVVDSDIYTALTHIVTKKLVYLKSIREAAELYDINKITEMKNYWTVFNFNKSD